MKHDYYRHMEPPARLKWYETALALRDNFNAIVKSEQTGLEIDPDKPLAYEGKRRKKRT